MSEQSTSSPSLANFDEYNAELQGLALKATRNAVGLPNDLGFYRTMDRGLAKEVDACSSRVLSLANRLLDLVSTGDSSNSKSKGKAVLEHDDVMDSFRSSVVDAMDRLLERTVSIRYAACKYLFSESELNAGYLSRRLHGPIKATGHCCEPSTSETEGAAHSGYS